MTTALYRRYRPESFAEMIGQAQVTDPLMTALRGDLQAIIARSSRLPSRDNIQVLAQGDTIVLRGMVRDDRERRLAEAVLRLSPGVREIRNELQTPGGKGGASP